MTSPIEEVLAVWREAERIHDALPRGEAVRERVAAAVVELRELHHRLFESSGREDVETTTAARTTTTRARALLLEARRRLASDQERSILEGEQTA